MTIKRLQILILCFIILPVFSFNQDDLTGLQIIERVYNRPVGENMKGDLTMTLINSRGNRRIRKIKQLTKDFGKMEKKIIVLHFSC